VRSDDPVADSITLSAVERGVGSGVFLPAENFWRTRRVKRYKNKPDELQDWLHLLDHAPTAVYVLHFKGLLPVTGLVLLAVDDGSVTVAWEKSAGSTVFRVDVRPVALGDDAPYTTVVTTSALQATVASLSPGTAYNIRVHAGQQGGAFEGQGATLVVKTGGVAGKPVCGNGLVEGDEQCEKGQGSTAGFGLCCDAATCMFTASRVVCRPSAGMCDAAESCTGGSAACPPDVPAANQLPCDDGDACTRDDVCFLGKCAGISSCQCTKDADCTSANPCTTGRCTENSCVWVNATSGDPCDDGVACTIADACDGKGACHGMTLDCAGGVGSCAASVCEDGACVVTHLGADIVCRAAPDSGCAPAHCTGTSPVCPATESDLCTNTTIEPSVTTLLPLTTRSTTPSDEQNNTTITMAAATTSAATATATTTTTTATVAAPASTKGTDASTTAAATTLDVTGSGAAGSGKSSDDPEVRFDLVVVCLASLLPRLL